jgi:hypothetical protein
MGGDFEVGCDAAALSWYKSKNTECPVLDVAKLHIRSKKLAGAV